jgi:hypothetical protein
MTVAVWKFHGRLSVQSIGEFQNPTSIKSRKSLADWDNWMNFVAVGALGVFPYSVVGPYAGSWNSKSCLPGYR